MSKNYLLGLNTRTIGTSGRTTTAVSLGSPYGGKGSVSRIYNWCSRTSSNPIDCVFGNTQTDSNSSWTNIDVSQLNLGEITGNIGSNGQIIIGGSNGGQLQFSTDLGNSWFPYPGSPNLPSVTTGIDVIGWSSVVMSDNTNFVVATPYVPNNSTQTSTYNGIYFTNNGGTNSWNTPLQSCPLDIGGGTLDFNSSPITSEPLLFVASGISQDGKYMAAVTTPRVNSSGDYNGELVYIIFSNNYGGNWSAVSLNPYTEDVVTTFVSSISICHNVNDYFLMTSKLYLNKQVTPNAYENGTCSISNNQGGSFTVPSGVTGNDFIYSSMSNDGKYQVVVTATNIQEPDSGIPSRLYLSSNSGSSFSQIIQLPYTDDTDYLKFGGVSMSADGKYITASVLDQYDTFQYIYLSSDIGVTWTKIYNDSSGSPFGSTNELGFLNTNASGRYQMLSGTNKLYINNNYGK